MNSSEQLVAVVAIVVREGAILAMRRAASKDAGAGLWETVSGRVEPGEDPSDAVAREIREETSLEIRLWPRPVDVYAAKRGSRPMVVIVFRADWVAGEVRRTEEHDDHRWMSLEEYRRTTTLPRLVTAVERALALEAEAAT